MGLLKIRDFLYPEHDLDLYKYSIASSFDQALCASTIHRNIIISFEVIELNASKNQIFLIGTRNKTKAVGKLITDTGIGLRCRGERAWCDLDLTFWRDHNFQNIATSYYFCFAILTLSFKILSGLYLETVRCRKFIVVGTFAGKCRCAISCCDLLTWLCQNVLATKLEKYMYYPYHKSCMDGCD